MSKITTLRKVTVLDDSLSFEKCPSLYKLYASISLWFYGLWFEPSDHSRSKIFISVSDRSAVAVTVEKSTFKLENLPPSLRMIRLETRENTAPQNRGKQALQTFGEFFELVTHSFAVMGHYRE